VFQFEGWVSGYIVAHCAYRSALRSGVLSVALLKAVQSKSEEVSASLKSLRTKNAVQILLPHPARGDFLSLQAIIFMGPWILLRLLLLCYI
jgi:hypothetical protein